MGAWGRGPFENDDAGDWVQELIESKDLGAIQSALAAPKDDAYLEAAQGAVIVGAAEVLAALSGHPSDGLPPEITAWIARRTGDRGQPLLPIAVKRVDRVLAAGSELRELWEENEEDYSAWRDSLVELKSRLSGL